MYTPSIVSSVVQQCALPNKIAHAAAVVISSRAMPLRPTRTRLVPWTVAGAFGKVLESARLLGAGTAGAVSEDNEAKAKAAAVDWLTETKTEYARAARAFGDVHSGDAALLYV